jgi:hypothetical protein
VVQEGGSVRITQEPRLAAVPGLGRGTPTFDLGLGASLPYSLTIETGASDGELQLGGLPLTHCSVKLGAGRCVLRFLEPNLQTMDVLDVDAGAGSFEMRGLGNANFTEMTLDGGAAALVCEFGGALQRDAVVHLSSGLTTLEVLVPSTTAAHILPEVTLGQLQTSDGFTTRDRGYWTPAALAGGRPLLTIHASIAMGTLHLRLSDS